MIDTKHTIQFVDLQRQYQRYRQEIDEAIASVIEQADFVSGQAVKDFAENFARFCEVGYCVPCANGTDALEIGMKALGIGAGDEVIVPANSFIASAEAVNNIGSEVVFCDVHPDSYNIDPQKIADKITPKTKAIMAVHLYGRVADMEPISLLAKKHGLFLVEDASQAHGALYRGKKAGNFGDFAVFSFYPGKNLGAYGDGGALVTNDENLYLHCKKLANHGRIAKYDHELIGRNSRLDTLQASILNTKLPHLSAWNVRRYEIAQRYHRLLADIPDIVPPKDFEGEQSVYHLYVIRVPATKRSSLQEHLKAQGIQTGVHYPISLPKLAAYAYLGHLDSDFPIANSFMNEILSLPIFPEMTDDEVGYVAQNVRNFFEISY